METKVTPHIRISFRQIGGIFAGLALLALNGAAIAASPDATIPIQVSSSESDTGHAGASAITLALPSGVVPGQLLLNAVAMHGEGAADAEISIPKGWSLIRDDTCGNDFHLSISFRLADGGDQPGTRFEWKFGHRFPGSGGITAYSGVNGAKPIGATSFLCSPSASTVTAPGIVTGGGNSLIVAVFGASGNDLVSAPNGLIPVYEHGVSAQGPVIAIADISAAAGTLISDQVATVETPGDNIGSLVVLNGE